MINLLYLYWFPFSCRPLAVISSLFWEIYLLFISDYSNAESGEPPLYMELEKDTPLQEDTAADAVLNPIYDRFVFFSELQATVS